MNMSHILDRARALIVTAGMAVVACLGAGQTAYAADAKMDPKMQMQGMTDAPAIIASAGIACDPVDAVLLGDTNYPDSTGKPAKAKLYEIACKAGPGFRIVRTADGAAHDPYTCMEAAKLKLTKPETQVCTLAENIPPYTWLQPIAQKYLPGCQISNARLTGSTADATPIDRYEVACGTAAGGLIDYPRFKSTAQVDYHNCLVFDGQHSACTLTTKAQMTAQMTPMAAKAEPNCQVTNVRFVGVVKDTQATYYEFGCSNQIGFITELKSDGSYSREVACANAANLGGCSLTDAKAISAGANGTYTALLKTAGKPCTVSDFNVAGSQESTHRDFVEFKCPEQPWGLIGLVPQAGTKSDVVVDDCFLDQVRHKLCTLTTAAQLKAQLDKLIKVAEPGKNCDVKDVRYIGEAETPENGVIVEIACVNKRGYIATISGDRTKLIGSDPCRLAAAHKEAEKCTIPENGTYAE